MKTPFVFALILAASLNPLSALALGESRNASEMSLGSVKCAEKALKEITSKNEDTFSKDEIKQAIQGGKKSAPAS